MLRVEADHPTGQPPVEVGVCSTRPEDTGVHTSETGTDTLRLLFETEAYSDQRFELDHWQAGSIPALGLTWVEGHPAPGRLASPAEVGAAAASVRERLDDALGVRRDRGVSRLDITTTRPFDRERDARAFLAGMAALELPRCETTWRGKPVHSIAWTHATGRRKLARCYDKGLERGGDPFELVRLEDQRRFPSGARPTIDVVADAEYQAEKFRARFEPMRKAVEGVRAATLPVLAAAIADEVRYGYRTPREAERLAGALVLQAGGVCSGDFARNSAGKRWLSRRRAELRAAGYVVVDDLLEPVEVDLGEQLDAALAEFG